MHHPLLLAGATACALVLLGACSSGSPSHTAAPTQDPVAAGKRIFQEGVDRNGNRIPRTGGIGMGMMAAGGCSSCHGIDGRGASTPMVQAPDITSANLTDPRGMLEVDGSRGMVYTDPLIRRAVTQGVGADGDELSTTMPRWQLTDQQWSDLLAYLRTLR